MKQEKIILVCVTDQKSCERLITAGYLLSKALDLRLKVLSVQPSNQAKNLRETPLEYLFNVCKSLDAEMQVYWGDNGSNVAVDYIRRNKVAHLVFGVPEKMVEGNFVHDVHQAFSDIPISIVDESNAAKILDFSEI
ncbi:K+-sensing histidine kinase KdpD [Anaerosolibacter carboniphilus]|uniref:K+-sensing histidine kinase KdpD n=1 Tax=Anaerosolibacter carboniphilus TaxID=1417629 RepID=A0A841KX52_9FIRM|nr:hypothetical protein [Anaerosolibacter carboniphilus]MBB6218286.1 K+-sensing histidine kinase KdpD [Anaerosolibacter carboniphilus]